MQVVDAIKNLAVAMKGSGGPEDIEAEQIADTIQWMADHWGEIRAGITAEVSPE